MKRILTLTGLAVLCSGCLMVPSTSISGALGGTPFSLKSPKDSTLVGLRLEAGTNGTMLLQVESLECRMNPDVVSMTGEAQVNMINAVASGVADAAAKAAVKAATNGIKP